MTNSAPARAIGTDVWRIVGDLAAVDLTLHETDLQQIAAALDGIAIVGDRYNAERQKQVTR